MGVLCFILPVISGARFGSILLLVLPALSGFAQNLAQNPGFESGTTGWINFGSGSFTTPATQPHTGTASAFLQNRTATWNGVAQSFLGVLQTNTGYNISAWVRIAN